jgi:hypothetical protein
MWFAETLAQRTGVHTYTYKLKSCANLRTINQGEFELATTLPYAAKKPGEVKKLLSVYQTTRSDTQDNNNIHSYCRHNLKSEINPLR